MNPRAATNHICKGWIRIPQYSILLNKLSRLTTKKKLYSKTNAILTAWNRDQNSALRWGWPRLMMECTSRKHTAVLFWHWYLWLALQIWFINLLPPFGAWKWSRAGSFRGREDTCKGVLVLGLSCLERKKERVQTQSVAMPHFSQQIWDLSVFCPRALQSNSPSLVRSKAVVDFSSSLSPATIPSAGKQGSRAATIHCHSLSQGPPALWLLISVHFSDLQFPDLQVVKILIKNTGLENVPE